MLEMLRDNAPYDGLFFDIHGAMSVEDLDDPEGDPGLAHDPLDEVVGVRRRVAAFHLQVKPASLHVDRADRALAERERVVVDRQVAEAELPAEREGECAGSRIGHDDPGGLPSPANREILGLADREAVAPRSGALYPVSV